MAIRIRSLSMGDVDIPIHEASLEGAPGRNWRVIAYLLRPARVPDDGWVTATSDGISITEWGHVESFSVGEHPSADMRYMIVIASAPPPPGAERPSASDPTRIIAS